MKKRILFILLFSFNLLSFSQEIPEFEGEIKWSELFKISRKTSSPTIIGQDGEHVFLIRNQKSKRYIEKYKLRTLQLVKSVSLELKYNKKNLGLIDQFMFGDLPVFYTSYYNKKEARNYYFIQKLNKSTLQISNPIRVGDIPKSPSKGVLGGLVSKAENTGASEMILSEDRELCFVTVGEYSNYSKEKKAYQTIKNTGRLYSDDLELLTEIEYKLPYDNFVAFQTKLGNDGLVYFAGYQRNVEVDESRLIARKTIVFEDLEILVLDPESGDVEVLEVSFEGKATKGFSFKVNEKSEIVISGLIGEEEGGVTGGFYKSYNSSLDEVSSNFFDFEDDFITHGWSDKAKNKLEKKNKKNKKKGKEKNKPTFYEYKVRDLIVKENGTATLLAEQYYVHVVTSTYTDAQGNTRTTRTYYYYYKDIIALNFDKEGELDWKTVIDKYQVSTNDGGYYSSFFTVLNGNDISIVYNDRESTVVDTEDMSLRERKSARRKIIAVRVLLDEHGDTEKEKLFEFEEGGLRLVPKKCSAAGEDLIFMYARAVRGDKIGTIEL